MYLVQSKKYAYRFHFVQALAPEWVLEALNLITSEATIGFEDGAEDDLEGIVHKPYNKATSADYNLLDDAIDSNDDDDDDINGGAEKVDLITKSIKSIEEVWHKDIAKTQVKQEQGEETETNVEPKEKEK